MNLKKKNLWSNCLTVTKNTCIHVQKLLIKSYFMLNITQEMVRAFGSVSGSFVFYLAVSWQNLSLVWHFYCLVTWQQCSALIIAGLFFFTLEQEERERERESERVKWGGCHRYAMMSAP